MKKKFLLLASLLALPALAFAAYNDVTLTTDAVITVGGINLTISGSSAVIESIVVNASDFSFTMQPSSSIKVSSADRRVLATDAASQYIVTNSCSSSESILEFAPYSITNVTISVTPQSSTCGANATTATVTSSSSSSSSGGGGGIAPAGLINPTPPSTVAQNVAITPATVTTAPAPAVPAASAAAPASTALTVTVSAVFTRPLSLGKRSSDVKRLQQLLNSDPDTRIAQSGAGSPGKETTYLGALTIKAIKKFQVKYGIAKPGAAGYGVFGPKTRARMQKVFGH